VPSNVVVFGHSHVWSFRRAIGLGIPQTEGFTFEAPLCGTKEMPGPIVLRDLRGRPQLTATLAALLLRGASAPNLEDTWLLSAVQGNHYNQMGMLSPDGPFDFVLEERQDLAGLLGAAMLPTAAVRAALRDTMDEIPDYLKVLGKWRPPARTLIAGPPPPGESEAPFIEAQASLATRHPVTAAPVRLKLWHLQNALYRDLCRQNGMIFVPGDIAGTQDEIGYLKPEYVKDSVHATHEWAMLYLQKVAGVIRARKEGRNV